MGEDQIDRCPMCGSTASMDATMVRPHGDYTTQLLYIKCNNDYNKDCMAELSMHADFSLVDNSNEVLIAAWNVMSRNKS